MKRMDYITLNDNAPVGVRIWYMREKLGMTQRDLSETIYVSLPSVIGWESGRQVPRFTSASLLAKVFGVSVDWLMAGMEVQNG